MRRLARAKIAVACPSFGAAPGAEDLSDRVAAIGHAPLYRDDAALLDWLAP